MGMDHERRWPTFSARSVEWLDFEFGSSARCHRLQKKPVQNLRAMMAMMGRISPNKKVDLDLESFPQDPDSSEGT
jgi:hypothetical protein